MKSVCVFVHYGHSPRLPYTEAAYIKELSKYFSEIVLVTNHRDFVVEDLPPKVSLELVKNEGYDFGMFYKVARVLDWQNLNRLALVNDSNFMIQSLATLFEIGEEIDTPFWGAIDSIEKPWFSTHADNYHLQSHFLVWEKTALPLLQEYLNQVPIQDFFDEKDSKKLRRKVINDWEIGISQYFMKNNIKPRAVFDSDRLSTMSSNKVKNQTNKTIKSPEDLLRAGYPFLKKRVVTRNGVLSRIFFPNRKWERLVFKYSFDATYAEQFIFSVKKEN